MPHQSAHSTSYGTFPITQNIPVTHCIIPSQTAHLIQAAQPQTDSKYPDRQRIPHQSTSPVRHSSAFRRGTSHQTRHPPSVSKPDRQRSPRQSAHSPSDRSSLVRQCIPCHTPHPPGQCIPRHTGFLPIHSTSPVRQTPHPPSVSASPVSSYKPLEPGHPPKEKSSHVRQ